MNLIRIITAIVIYLVYSFAEWDFNVSHWGFFARLTFIFLIITSAIFWWLIGAVFSSKKEQSKSDVKFEKSGFQKRLEELAEKRNQEIKKL